MWNELTILWNDLTIDWNEMTGYRHAPSRLQIFVTENTESDTFCMEEYSKKYTIGVRNSLLR